MICFWHFVPSQSTNLWKYSFSLKYNVLNITHLSLRLYDYAFAQTMLFSHRSQRGLQKQIYVTDKHSSYVPWCQNCMHSLVVKRSVMNHTINTEILQILFLVWSYCLSCFHFCKWIFLEREHTHPPRNTHIQIMLREKYILIKVLK